MQRLVTQAERLRTFESFSRSWATCWLMTVAVLLGMPWGESALGAGPASRPNIVILFADDLGYGELGFQGNEQIPTPHIDAIAKQGVRFTDGYVTASYCSPSRAGMLSGRYQARFGYHTNTMPHTVEGSNLGIPANEVTLAEQLKKAGYRTGLIGKWHLGSRADFNPTQHGFDYFYGFAHEGRFFVRPPYNGVTTMLRKKPLPEGKQGRWVRPDGKLYLHDMLGNEPLYDLNNPMLRNREVVQESRYLTDAFTDEAVKFIDRNKEQPFFLYLAYNAVHSPLQGADAYMERMAGIKDVQRRIFAAMLSNLDDSVGAVMQKLCDEKLEENTLVLFLSDNGGPTKELTSSNLPLRGGKGSYYEGGIRIPFAVQWKGKLPAGETYNQPVISLDIYATAAKLAGREIQADQYDGVDLLPYLTGEVKGAPHERLFWYYRDGGALREGPWKLVKTPRGEKPFELYNLNEDLSETQELSQAQAERFSHMKAAWQTMASQMPQE